MKRLFLASLVAVFGLTAHPRTLAPPHPGTPAPLEVLFIGNSYTFVNNLGDMLAGVAASLPGPRIHPTLIVGGGMTLQWHYAAGKALAAIDSQHWDHVILQEQSVFGSPTASFATDDDTASTRVEATLPPPTIFHESVRKFVPRIRAAGSTPMLLMTWARRRYPDEQATLSSAYRTIASELNVKVAPAGLAWQEVHKRWPDLDLFLADGAHPNGAGTYLTACVLYVALTGNDARGAAPVITGHPYSGRDGVVDLSQTVPLASLTPAVAKRLQDVAWEISGRPRPVS